MCKRIVLSALMAGLAALLTPALASAYGAAHVGYTHVGPNGVYHEGATVAGGYGGGYHTTYGPASQGNFHTTYGGAAYGGAAYGGYHYTTGYAGGAAYGGYHYGYIR